jgi:WD40 repeat protein
MPFNGLVSFSPDGTELALGWFIKETYLVDLYRTADWTLRLTLTNRLGQAVGAPPVYSPDNQLLVVPGQAGLLTEAWQVRSGEWYGIVRDYERHGGPYRQVLFSQDGQMLLTTADNEEIRFWEVQPGESERPLLVYDQGVSGVSSIVISPKGGLTALGMTDGQVMVIHTPIFVTAASQAGDQFVLEWAGGSAQSQVQRRPSLTSGDWENVGEPTTTRSLTLPASSASMFYRVVSLPE